MGLPEAKTRCRQLLGRMPRIGYEVLVLEDTVSIRGFQSLHRVYLANESGRLRVWEWFEPVPMRR